MIVLQPKKEAEVAKSAVDDMRSFPIEELPNSNPGKCSVHDLDQSSSNGFCFGNRGMRHWQKKKSKLWLIINISVSEYLQNSQEHPYNKNKQLLEAIRAICLNIYEIKQSSDL